MGFQESTLSNGLEVVTERLPNVRSVAIGFWVDYGSRDEIPEMSGSAHFIEHLLFKGTKARSAQEISEAFESLGAEFNAFTTKEQTGYHARLLDQHMPEAISLLSDMIEGSVMKSEDIEAERSVILEEIRGHEDAPDDHVHDLFLENLWSDHPLGRPVAGTYGTVGDVSREQLVELYKRVYRADRMVIAATGNLDHDDLVARLESAKLPVVETSADPRNIQEAGFQPHTKVIRRDSEQSHIVMGAPALKAHDPERFAFLILDCALGGGMSSRLFQEIREKNSMAYSVFSHYSMYSDAGYHAVYAGTNPARANEAVKRIKDELGKISTNGITAEELQRCREHMKGQMVLSFESTGHRMFRLGRAKITKGEMLTLDELIEKMDSVSLEQVNALAARIYSPEDLAITVLGPLDEGAIDE